MQRYEKFHTLQNINAIDSRKSVYFRLDLTFTRFPACRYMQGIWSQNFPLRWLESVVGDGAEKAGFDLLAVGVCFFPGFLNPVAVTVVFYGLFSMRFIDNFSYEG